MPMERIREGRCSRALRREGLVLRKTHRRNPQLREYGGYMIVEPRPNAVVAGGSPFA